MKWVSAFCASLGVSFLSRDNSGWEVVGCFLLFWAVVAGLAHLETQRLAPREK